MRTITAAAVALLLACSAEDESAPLPDVSTRYTIGAGTVTCDAPPEAQEWDYAAGTGTCVFEAVSVDGTNRCYAAVSFGRTAPGEAWTVTAVFPSRAERCPSTP